MTASAGPGPEEHDPHARPDPNELPRLRAEFAELYDRFLAAAARLDALERRATAQGHSVPPARGLPPVPRSAALPPRSLSPPLPVDTTRAGAPAGSEPEVLLVSDDAPQPGLPLFPDPARPTSQAASAPWSAVDLESLVGGHWLNRIGIGILLLSLAFLLHWVWWNFDVPPWLTIAGIHALGLGFLGGAYYFQRVNLPIFAQGLIGAGLFVLYAGQFAEVQLYELVPAEVGFAEGLLVTALALVLAVRMNSPAVVVLGALGGYLMPFLNAGPSGSQVVLFAYLACLNLALLGAAVWRGWSWLKPLTWLATAIMFVPWLDVPLRPDREMIWTTQVLVSLHSLLFLASATLPPWIWARPSRGPDLLALGAASLGFLGATWLLFSRIPGQQLALLSWGMTFAHLGLFAVTRSRVTLADGMPRVQLALAAVFFTLAAPLQLEHAGQFLGATWAAQLLIFAAVGIYFRDRQLLATSAVLGLLALGRLVTHEFHGPTNFVPGTSVDQSVLLMVCGGLTMMVAGALRWSMPRWSPADDASDSEEAVLCSIFLGVGNAILLLAASRQWDDVFYVRWAVTLIWTLDLGIWWAAGFALRLRAARWYAIALLVLVHLRMVYPEGFEVAELTNWLPLLNPRFFVAACVALVTLAASWAYRRLDRTDSARESQLAVPLLLLGHLVLLVVLTWEVETWFHQQRYLAGAFSPNSSFAPSAYWGMAEQASYSTLWSIYAGLVIALGFLVHDPLRRWLGLAGFGLIVLKVFLVDLSELTLMPRVIAFAALGLSLIAISYLYQRFKPTSAVGENAGPQS